MRQQHQAGATAAGLRPRRKGGGEAAPQDEGPSPSPSPSPGTGTGTGVATTADADADGATNASTRTIDDEGHDDGLATVMPRGSGVDPDPAMVGWWSAEGLALALLSSGSAVALGAGTAHAEAAANPPALVPPPAPTPAPVPEQGGDRQPAPPPVLPDDAEADSRPTPAPPPDPAPPVVAPPDEPSPALDVDPPAAGRLISRTALLATTGQQQVFLSTAGEELGADVRFEVSRDGGATWATTGASLNSLLDGDYQFRALVTDAAGNSSHSAAQTLNIDATPPRVGAMRIELGTDTGISAFDRISQTRDVDLSAEASPGTLSFEHSIDGGLTWSTVDPAVRDLPDGDHLFRAVLTDAFGRSATSAAVSVTVDTLAPAIGRLDLVAPGGQGDATSGYVLKQASFSFSLDGGADTASFHEVSTNGGLDWLRCGASPAGLLDGDYLFRAGAVDAAGNTALSNVVAVRVDTREAVAGSLLLTGFADSGSDALDRVTSIDHFVLALTGTAASAVSTGFQVTRSGTQTWVDTSAAQSALSDGNWQYRGAVVDADGSTHYTRAITVRIDTAPPTAVKLSVADLDDTGGNATDGITRDNTFRLQIGGGAGRSSVAYENSTNGGRTWQACGDTLNDLADGSYLFRAWAIDAAGNRDSSASRAITIDTSAPAPGHLVLEDFEDTGLAADLSTTDASFSLALAGQDAGATVLFERSDDAGVNWFATATAQRDLAPGSHHYRATVSDLAGNTATTGVIEVRIDAPDPLSAGLARDVWLPRDPGLTAIGAAIAGGAPLAV